MFHKLNWINPKINYSSDSLFGRCEIAGGDLSKGDLLVVFGGHVMTMEEFYLLDASIQEFPYQISESPDLLFGPAKSDEIEHGEFFNHSCSPNAGFKSAMELVAMRDILKNEQITFDYAMCMTGAFGNMKCDCRTKECRDFISGDDWKIAKLQTRYRGYFQPYIEDKISQFVEQSDKLR